MLITMKRRCFKVFSGATPVIGDKSACHGTACYFLSSRPADSVAWRRPASSRPGQAGWEPECPGGEANSVARLCGQGIDRRRQGGCEQRTGERVRSGQQQRQLAGGFAARFGRCPIHMIIGESAGSASSGRLLSALGLAWVTPRIAVGRRPNRSSKKQQSAWQTTSAFIRVPPPQQWVKKWANSTKIARLATGKSTLPTVK